MEKEINWINEKEEPKNVLGHYNYVIVFGLEEPTSPVIQKIVEQKLKDLKIVSQDNIIFDFWKDSNNSPEKIIQYVEHICSYIGPENTLFAYMPSLSKDEAEDTKKGAIDDYIEKSTTFLEGSSVFKTGITMARWILSY